MEKRRYPPDGEVFALTLDGDAPENQPLEMVRHASRDNEGWKHDGPIISGKRTHHFKWVALSYCRDLAGVRQKLVAHGTLPEGQWCEAVKATFQPDGQRPGGRTPLTPRGIADASWTNPRGDACFPCVHADGDPSFFWAGSDFANYWRWLVKVD